MEQEEKKDGDYALNGGRVSQEGEKLADCWFLARQVIDESKEM